MTDLRHDWEVREAKDVQSLLDRWAHAGLIGADEVKRIEAFEARAALDGEPATPHVPARQGLIAEALAYLGGVLALGAALLLVQVAWPQLSTAARVGLPAAATVALLLAGALVPGRTGQLRRLRSVLWLLSICAWAATLAVLGDQVLELADIDSALMVAVGSVVLTLTLYIRETNALQHLALLASVAGTGAALGARVDWDEPTFVGLGIWLVAAAWSVAGELGYMPPQETARYGTAIAMIAGALAMGQSPGGQAVAAVTVLWLFVVGIWRGRVGVLAVAAFGTLQLLPQSVEYFFPGNTRVAVPVTLLAVGAAMVGAAVAVSRHRHRSLPERPEPEPVRRTGA